MITTSYRSTRKGKVQRLVSEIYLRNDIPCGLEYNYTLIIIINFNLIIMKT